MTVRWGIIGCGDVCEVKSGPALYTAEGSALTFVMRRDAAKVADFARRHGVPRHTTRAADVIESDDVDAVYVATPPGQHLDYALAVARAGKPCYVEKPMARSAMECRTMLEAFERAGQRLFVAYYRRALPRFAGVKAVLDSGELGQLLAVRHVYQGRAHPERRSAGWRERVSDSGGGLFLDLGSHVVDVLDFLLGPLSGVAGHAARRSSAGPALPEDTVAFSFMTASGVVGTAQYQFHTHQALDRLEFVGTQGNLALSVFGQDPLELIRGDARQSIPTDHPQHVQLPLVRSIVSELSGGAVRCPSTGVSALRASVVMDQVLAAYYGGREDAFWARPETWPGALR